MKKVLTLTAAALLLAACGGKQEASEANFKRSLTEAERDNRVCLPLPLEISQADGTPAEQFNQVGESVLRIVDRNLKGERINQEAQKQIDVLVDEGFYEKDKSETLPVGGTHIKLTSYIQTDKGRRNSLMHIENNEFVRASFCVGKEKVVKVNWFTPPAQQNGVTLSNVSYHLEFQPEDWVEEFGEAIGLQNFGNLLMVPYDRTVVMMQTNKGWRKADELNNSGEVE